MNFIIGVFSIVLSCLFSFILLPAGAMANDVRIASLDTNQLGGVPEQILTMAYEKLGLSVSFERFPLNKSLEVANAGDMDGETGRVEGLEKKYPNLRRVPVQIDSLDAVALATKPGIEVDGWESLSGYRVGYIAGGQLVEQKTRGWERVSVVKDMSQGLRLLIEGDLDVFIDERRHAAREIAFFRLDSVKILEPAIVEIPLYHYVHKKNAHLIPRLTEVLKDMKATGVIEKIATGDTR